MPDDRFGDLGVGGGDGERRSAAERFEEQDRINPEPDSPQRRPEVPRPGNRYAWVVGIVMLMGVSVLLLTSSLRNGDQGVRGPQVGKVAPDFAAPSATGNAANDADSNVRQATGGSDAAGDVPACELVTEEVVNVCELRRKPLVLTLLVTRGADCEPQVDRVERMRDEFPQVEFAAIVSGNERDDVERLVDRRRWRMPVGVDHDGAVAKLYGVAVCPTTVFSLPGGRVESTEIGNLTEDQLRAKVRRLLERARDRAR